MYKYFHDEGGYSQWSINNFKIDVDDKLMSKYFKTTKVSLLEKLRRT